MKLCGEIQKNPTRPTTLLKPTKKKHFLMQKAPFSLGTWNVRTLLEPGRCAQVAKEMANYKLQILGLSEVRWNTFGETRLQTGETLLFSGMENEEDTHENGVALLLNKDSFKSLLEWEPVSDRIIRAKFLSRFQNVHIVMCYAPTNLAPEEDKVAFYERLQSIVDRIPKRDILILMGDMNAKIGNENKGREKTMGIHGLGNMNENGEMFANFCTFNELVIGGSIFPHKKCHKATWVSPDNKTENQIDHIAICRTWRSTLQDVRTKRGADIGSDHHLVVAKLKIKLAKQRSKTNRRTKFDLDKLQNSQRKCELQLTLKNRFSALQPDDTEEGIDKTWDNFKEIIIGTCNEVLRPAPKNKKHWISDETWQRIEDRKHAKQTVNQAKTRKHKQLTQQEYHTISKEVSKMLRHDKRTFYNKLAEQAEEAAGKGDLKQLYKITKLLSGKKANYNVPVRDKQGKLLSSIDDQLRRWKEYFQEVLNRPTPLNPPDLTTGETLDINMEEISKEEIWKAINQMKTGKAAGIDNIPPEVLKEGGAEIVNQLHNIFNKIWSTETPPAEWKKGLLIKIPKNGDLSRCDKWRGITLLSVPSKVFSRTILNRIKEACDDLLREEQAGFRRGRSCIDQIATLRIIIEQSIEWQSPLYATFVDFEKAFDSINRETIWSIMRHYGIPNKIIAIIKSLYENFTCQIVHNGKMSDEFHVTTGVKQGCLLSPLLFLLVLDWVTKEAYANSGKGIQWTLMQKLEDLEFADDLAILSHRLQDMQEKTTALSETGKRVGLGINHQKTKVLKINHQQDGDIQVENQSLDQVNHFVYLGSVVSASGGADEDIERRINLARQAFANLKQVWRSTYISVKTKVRIFNTNIKTVLLYGSETWRTTEKTKNRLQTFVNRCLRNILKIKWFDKVENSKLWERCGQRTVEQQIMERKWRWIGHTLRKDNNNRARQALEWNPQGKRHRGRPKRTWRRSILDETERTGKSWEELKRLARDREEWRALTEALCSTRNPKDR